MAKVRVTRALTPTVTGNQDITIAGFGTVKGAIVISTNAQSDNIEAANASVSMGFADGTNIVCDGGSSADGETTSIGKRRSYTGEIVHILKGSSVDAIADGCTFITDGIRLSWSSAHATQRFMTVILIGGSDVSCAVGAKLFSATVGNTDSVTGLGFQPTCVFMSTEGAGSDDYYNNHPTSGFGVAVDEGGGVISQVEWGSGEQVSQSTANVDGSVYDNRIATQNYPATAWEAELTSFDADGFTITARTSDIGDWIHYLAIDFGSASLKVGIDNSPTGTGNWNMTGIGFKPQFAMMGLSFADTLNVHDNSGNGGCMGFSFFDKDGNEFSQQYRVEDGAATTNTGSLCDNRVLSMVDNASGILYEGTFSSFNSDGWTINSLTVNDDRQRKWPFFAVEEESTGYTLTAEAGVFNTAGQDVDLIADLSAYTLTAEAGTFTTSGQDAGLVYSGGDPNLITNLTDGVDSENDPEGGYVTTTYTYTLQSAQQGKYIVAKFTPKLTNVQNTDGEEYISDYTNQVT